jgi:chaperonin cofactor prefoldin
MEYPGGFTDEVLYPVNELGLTPERVRYWLRQAKEVGLRLIGSEEAVGGPSLPFLLLLEQKGEKPGEGEAFRQAYWAIVEEVLNEPPRRGALLELLGRLGGLRKERSEVPKEPPPGSGYGPEGRKRGVEQRKEKTAKGEGKRGGEPVPHLPDWEARFEAIEGRIEALERQSKAHDLSLSSFAELLARLQGDIAKIKEELEVWGEHLQFFNDRLYGQETRLQEDLQRFAKELEELKGSLGNALMQLQALRRAVTPQ